MSAVTNNEHLASNFLNRSDEKLYMDCWGREWIRVGEQERLFTEMMEIFIEKVKNCDSSSYKTISGAFEKLYKKECEFKVLSWDGLWNHLMYSIWCLSWFFGYDKYEKYQSTREGLCRSAEDALDNDVSDEVAEEFLVPENGDSPRTRSDNDWKPNEKYTDADDCIIPE